mmetsp:Transcript_9884/g.28671  ORF Transcript_9884/g.28671 Transcript_9884/m.28671 type:complete len:225 (-) Transcript_9884:7-681(-)
MLEGGLQARQLVLARVLLRGREGEELLHLDQRTDHVRKAEELQAKLDRPRAGALSTGQDLPLLHVPDMVHNHERRQRHLLQQVQDAVHRVLDGEALGDALDHRQLLTPTVRAPRACKLHHRRPRVALDHAQLRSRRRRSERRQAHEGSRRVLKEARQLVPALGLAAEEVEVVDGHLRHACWQGERAPFKKAADANTDEIPRNTQKHSGACSQLASARRACAEVA